MGNVATKFRNVLRRLRVGVPLDDSPELDALAERAFEAVQNREAEDVETWARRLAEQTSNAGD